MPIPYIPDTNPGYAASGAIEDFLAKQQAQKRQAMLDSITQSREQRLAKSEDLDIQLRRDELTQRAADRAAALKERTDTAAEKANEKQFNQTVTAVGQLAPGDIPDQSLIQQAQSHHVPIRLGPSGSVPIPAGQSQVELPGATDPLTGAPTPPALAQPDTLPGAAPAGSLRIAPAFLGSPKQQQEIDQKKRIDEVRAVISTADPGSPEWKRAAIDYGMLIGKPLTAAEVVGSKPSEDEPVMRQNPVTGAVERQVDGQWVAWKGNAPPKSHWMTVPDTSARDAAATARQTAADDRQSAHADQIRENGYREFDALAKPAQQQLEALNNLGLALNQRTNTADSLIAPLVLKATVSGMGSGFRMTQPEINSVIKSRSGWDSLQLTLNKWMSTGGVNPDGTANPDKPLVLTDAQKDDMRNLAKAIRTKAAAQVHAITTARHKLDDAMDSGSINKVRSGLQDVLYPAPDAAETAAPAPTTLPPGVTVTRRP